MNNETMARHINTLGAFCGRRDVPALTTQQLQQVYGLAQADVMVLFGGSILCGAQVLARAMQQGIAKKYIIVGGAGHTTQALREQVQAAVPTIDTQGLTEAAVFAAYLQHRYGLAADYLEHASTNCGNNITNLLALLEQKQVVYDSIILCQDAAMQRRMDAVLRKHCAPELRIVNYAAYAATLTVKNGALVYAQPIEGMWELQRYLSLLLGEIPRLTDDENGYGPRGKGFIAHVEVPSAVREAFAALQAEHSALVREANPLYASQG